MYGLSKNVYVVPVIPVRIWICDIYHKQIHGRKQISIRCNMIENCVHL